MYRTIALINLLVFWQFPAFTQTISSNSLYSESSESQYCTDKIEKEDDFFSTEQQESLVKSITVKVKGDNNGGSGTLLGKEGNSYIVITNAHVVTGVKSIELTTHDGKTYPGEIIQDLRKDNGSVILENNLKKYDLALLRFQTDRTYCLLPIAEANPTSEYKNMPIMVAGFSSEKGKMISLTAEIQEIPKKVFKEGYQIGYNVDAEKGMSGGAIINSYGNLIGINGRGTYPISNRGYTFEDDSRPSNEEIKNMRSLSWGIPVITFLKKVDPSILDKYSLAKYLPKNFTTVSQPQWKGWVAQLEEKTKRFTVQINISNKNERANGSGIIIREQNNVYTVLTSAHVICKKDQTEKKSNIRQCLDDYNYKIIGPDREYIIDKSTIQVEEGVDLAIFQFTSKQHYYQVAVMANYNPTNKDYVFTAGYPQIEDGYKWTFTGGRIFEKEEGLTKVITSEFENGRLKGGYEFVYTNATFEGMSGGPVLDSDGRVIAIHGAAEAGNLKEEKTSTMQQLKIGYSLGIPVSTFLGLEKKFGVKPQNLKDKPPEKLNDQKIRVIEEYECSCSMTITDNAIPEELITRGNQLWRLGANEKAVTEFDRAINSLINRPSQTDLIYLAYFGKGLALSNLYETEEALKAFKEVVKINPKFAAGWQQISKSYQNLNEYQKALDSIDEAIKLQENNPNLHNARAFILNDLKRINESEVAMKRATELSHLAKFRYYLGNIYGMQKKWDDALIQFTEVITINPKDMNAFRLRGLVYKNKGEWQKALEDYNTVIKNKPEDVDVYIYLGNWYSDSKNKDKNPDSALENYNKAIEIDENNAQAYRSRGVYYENAKQLDKALEDYKKAIELEPDNAYAYIYLGNIYANSSPKNTHKNDTKALENYNKAIEIDENNAQAYRSRGVYYENAKQLDKALEDYKKAIELEPDNAYAYIYLGDIYANSSPKNTHKNDTKALENYNKAIEIDENNAQAYRSRGVYYENAKQLDKALEDYKKAIDIEADNTNAYIARGVLYIRQKNWNLGFEDCKKAIQMEPDNPSTYMCLGLVYHSQEKWDSALDNYNKVLQLNSDYVAAIDNIGLIKYEQGALDVAIQQWQNSINIDSKSAEPHLALAIALYTKGEKQKAYQIAEVALRLDKSFADIKVMEEKLWQERLISDAQKLLSSPEIQALLSRLP
ncbi:tetratricopeptide repeat protein [Calothrix sp. FACHB-156]|nr:tetratricopeptide repeat protein [Calothrix sp. FACHB-156]